ncbi:MAG TPA: twin-arginine translocation signal domain-containing protein, partial [Gemmataceae bacterium]|nr:twin-arginine translocation signal domain-containing protein [Gemmataceae bacterium]
MSEPTRRCPDCDADGFDRRRFLKTVAGAAATIALPPVIDRGLNKATAAPTPTSAAETVVKGLFDSLSPEQKSKMCFAWGHQDPKRGLLRTHVSNNWNVTPQMIRSDFYTQKQQHLIHDIYKAL